MRSPNPLAATSPVALPVLRQRAVGARRLSPLCFAQSQDNKPSDPVLAYAESIGLPTSEGVFGFKPFAEIWCGRLAMMGFIVSIAEEFATGQGTLAQIHLLEPGQPDTVVLAVLMAFFGGAMLIGSAQTLNGLRNGTLSVRDVLRYKNFLALASDADAKNTAAEMKRKGDFTTPGVNPTQIAESKAAGTPADAFLSTNDVQEGDAAAREMKGQASPAAPEGAQQPPQQAQQAPAQTPQKQKDIMSTYLFSGNAEMRYAQNIELENGRWAMIGFLVAVLVEAATGQGIIGQLFGYAKWSGLLGKDSGF